MNNMLETLLEREIRRVLDSAADDTNADCLAGQLVALRWALAKVRRQQANRKFFQLARNSTPVL